MTIKLSPSILSADFANLERDIKIAVDAGAEYVHVDVMDGHFVPNITIGAPVVKALRKATDAVLDVHLMISDPDKYLDDFIKAGSDIITVHYESNGDTLEQLKKIRAAGVKAACVIKPGTPADVLVPLLPYCDMVLIMTVEPGFGGQGFIPECMDKIKFVRKAIQDGGYNCGRRGRHCRRLGGIRRRHRSQRQGLPRSLCGRCFQGELEQVKIKKSGCGASGFFYFIGKSIPDILSCLSGSSAHASGWSLQPCTSRCRSCSPKPSLSADSRRAPS